MAELPFMPVATDALLADVGDLPNELFGAYCRLLFRWWREGAKPEKSGKRLARWSGLSHNDFEELLEFLTETEDGWVQKRLLETFQKSELKSKKAREAAHKRWHGDGDADAVITQCEGNANHNHNHNYKKEKKEGAKRASRLSKDFQLPDDWKEYAQNGGLSLAEIEGQFQDMVDWSISSPQGKKLDWDRTWQTWCRRHKSWGNKIRSDQKSIQFEMPKNPMAADKAQSLLKRVGNGPYASFFGANPPKLVGETWVVDPGGSATKADMIHTRFSGALDDVYGKGYWTCFAGRTS